jgi:ATP-dependent Clp protease protease subunit
MMSDREALLEQRIVLVEGEINDQQATDVIARLLFLQYDDPHRPILLQVDSEGGSVAAGMAIVDTLKSLSPPVHTCCRHRAHGIAALIVASGRRGCRSATPYAELSIGPITWARPEALGKAERERIHNLLAEHLAEQTGKARTIVAWDLSVGQVFDGCAAAEYGLVDQVMD